MITAKAFTQVSANRWSVDLTSEHPIDEIAAFITEPLPAGAALGCHVACAPFEQASWHYLGAISTELHSVVFKTRYVWSARDAVPTMVQFGVELTQSAELAQAPAEKVRTAAAPDDHTHGMDPLGSRAPPALCRLRLKSWRQVDALGRTSTSTSHRLRRL